MSIGRWPRWTTAPTSSPSAAERWRIPTCLGACPIETSLKEFDPTILGPFANIKETELAM